MTKFRLALQAEEDLLTIISHVADESPDAAKLVRNAFEEAFITLGENPGIGHFREELLDKSFKFWSVYSYLIVYRWQFNPIQILVIVHGARDLGPLFRRRRVQ